MIGDITKIEADGYVHALASTHGVSKYYRCAKFNGKKCTSRLVVKMDLLSNSREAIHVKMNHPH